MLVPTGARRNGGRLVLGSRVVISARLPGFLLSCTRLVSTLSRCATTSASSLMPPLPSFIRPLPAVRRAYSVYTKPGGGRFFNAAKQLAQTNNSNKSEHDGSAAASTEPVTPGSIMEDADPKSANVPARADSKTAFASRTVGVNLTPLPVHPPVNPQDLKLHQFFSLYRPLLTISQPTSSIFESTTSPFLYPPAADADAARRGIIDEPPEASPESDADAARVLARALVSSRVGAALSWQDTLRRLGLDESKGHAEEVQQAQVEFDMYMDSTRRKRRKKMKKHKCVGITFLLYINAHSLCLGSKSGDGYVECTEPEL
ncbi:hypothetical protein BDW22DRAFT_1022353 [Trametopsis cervina]|nr:hypothetical protein BDW22DRAFT_1022353 [Trametopsis cervina]